MVATHAKFTSDLNTAEAASRSAATRIASSFRAVDNAAQGISRGLTLLKTALGVDLIIRGFDLIIKKPLELADNIDEMAQRLGVSTDRLQELLHAATVTGASIEDLEVGLRNLNRRLGEAGAGERSAVDLFKRMGISQAQASALELGDALDVVADKLAKTSNEQERTRLEMELFGRSGTKLHPMLAEGAAGLKKYGDEARRLGLVMDESMIQKAGKANDQLDVLARVIKVNLATAIAEFTASDDFAKWFQRAAEAGRGMIEVLKQLGVLEKTPEDKIKDLRAEIERLEKGMARISKGDTLGDRINRFFGHDTNQKGRVEELKKQIDAILEAEAMKPPPPPDNKKRTPVGPTPEQLRALDDFRDKFKDATTTNAAEKAIQGVVREAAKLAETAPLLTGQIDEITGAWIEFIEAQDRARVLLEAYGKIQDSTAQGFEESTKLQGEITQGFKDVERALEDVDRRAFLTAEPFDLIGEKIGVISSALPKLAEFLPVDDPRLLELKKQLEDLARLRRELADVNENVTTDMGGVTGTREAVAESEKPLDDLRDQISLIDKQAKLFGDTWGGVGTTIDATAMKIDATTAAMKKMLEEGVDPADPKLQQLKTRLEELERTKSIGDAFRDLFGAIDSSITRSVTGVIQGTTTMKDAFRNLGQSIALAFFENGVKRAVDLSMKAVKDFLDWMETTGLIKKGIGLVLGLFGAGSGAAGASGGGNTGVGLGGGGADFTLPAFAKGGVVKARPGGRLIIAGEAGQDEAIVPLTRLGGSGEITVQIINQTGVAAEGSAQETTGPDGQRMLQVFVTRAMKEAFNTGSMDPTMRNLYRLTRAGVSR
jgi:archaellum component FlaC